MMIVWRVLNLIIWIEEVSDLKKVHIYLRIKEWICEWNKYINYDNLKYLYSI